MSVQADWTVDAIAAAVLHWYQFCHRYSVVFHTAVWRTSQWSTSHTRSEWEPGLCAGRCCMVPALELSCLRVIVMMCRDGVIHCGPCRACAVCAMLACLMTVAFRKLIIIVLLVTIIYYVCPCFVLVAYWSTLRLNYLGLIHFTIMVDRLTGSKYKNKK